jgi:hypothetical protein
MPKKMVAVTGFDPAIFGIHATMYPMSPTHFHFATQLFFLAWGTYLHPCLSGWLFGGARGEAVVVGESLWGCSHGEMIMGESEMLTHLG